jgi:hypothetical protein
LSSLGFKPSRLGRTRFALLIAANYIALFFTA